MVRFSCFSTPPASRSKKVPQRSIGTLQSDYQSATQDQSIKLVKGSGKSKLMPDNYNSCYSVRNTSPYALRDYWRSDGLNVKLPEDDQEMLQTVLIKKSHSLGRIKEKERGYSGDDITEDDDIDRKFSFDSLNGRNLKEVPESSDNDNADFTEIFHRENGRKSYQIQKENDLFKPFDILKDLMHNESLFSVEVLKQPNGDRRADVDEVADSGCSSEHLPNLSRSYSVANLRVNETESSKYGSSHHGHIFRRSRSFSDLKNLNILETELQNGEKYTVSGNTVEKSIIVSRSNLPLHHELNRKVPCCDDKDEGGLCLVRKKIVKFRDSDGKCLSMKLDMDNKAARNSQCNVNFADALRKSETNDAKITRECQQESSSHNWDQLTPQEFSLRRVENWISRIDIHGDLVVEEDRESSTTVSKEEPQILASVDTPKFDTRSNLAIEVAYNYISSLTSSSSSAQMANLGLVAIPVLSSFVSLRVLNLAGNALVHITPGCLPKGLHMLNLSKNNISTIEGLRDLSRLRVLDLNYNRIARIGHGLSSCSSLKELYLAGNKISEVEGLHRLLKLNILDLRLNKISTSKGLRQLAANYAYLQAINLEGNPAQKNVGDEQLKKFLLGLLPNLVYYNKQAIRMGSKEVSGNSSPQFDKDFSAIRTPSRKPSKGRHVRLKLPPASSKLTNLGSETGKKPLGKNGNDAVNRSRSTYALRGFFKL